MRRLLLPIAPALPLICCVVACSIIAVAQALLTYALGWPDNAQRAGLFAFGLFAGYYTGWILATTPQEG